MDNQDRNVDQFGKPNRAVCGLVFGKLYMTDGVIFWGNVTALK